ncbi:MAG TPA: type II toxin-antitoxin system HicB family antitoxin [Thermoanaerobaculia bacterium]|nr:type II toxin-antitoxin system HicB family antitoxin [Thermoanaerobaculia bacterium]
MKSLKILIEQHSDGYVAYPLKIKGVVVGQGDTYEEALADVESAVLFHVETFGVEVLHSAEPTSPNLDLQEAPEGGDSV